MKQIKNIEIYNASAVAYALLGVGIKYEFRGKSPWLNLFVDKKEDDNLITQIVDRAISASAQPPFRIKAMAEEWATEIARGQ